MMTHRDVTCEVVREEHRFGRVARLHPHMLDRPCGWPFVAIRSQEVTEQHCRPGSGASIRMGYHNGGDGNGALKGTAQWERGAGSAAAGEQQQPQRAGSTEWHRQHGAGQQARIQQQKARSLTVNWLELPVGHALV